MSLTEVSLIASSFWTSYRTCIACKIKVALELWKGDGLFQGLMQGKYQGKMSFVFLFLPNSVLSRDLILFGGCQHIDTTKLRDNQRMTQRSCLLYRFTTNVLFKSRQINLAFFCSSDKGNVIFFLTLKHASLLRFCWNERNIFQRKGYYPGFVYEIRFSNLRV